MLEAVVLMRIAPKQELMFLRIQKWRGDWGFMEVIMNVIRNFIGVNGLRKNLLCRRDFNYIRNEE